MSISIVIPTRGKPALLQAMLSLSCQIRPEDEVIVSTDGQCSAAEEIAASSGVRHRLVVSDFGEHGCGHRCGNAARGYGMRRATRDTLAFLDDDDIYLPGALEAIRTAVNQHPERPLIFRMIHRSGRVLWRSTSLRFGNVGTPMIVVPNDAARLGRWGLRSGGDFDFAADTMQHYPEGPVWRREIICLCRPQ